MPFATVTLVYDCPIALQQAAKLITRMGTASIYKGELNLLGMTLNADSVALSGSTAVRRTIVLNVMPQGNIQFPSADLLKAATRGLYKSALEFVVPTVIAAQEPVVA